jgi:hypothetical protein
MSAQKAYKQRAAPKAFHVEANHPEQSSHWKFLWEVAQEDWIKTQGLIDELNVINAPVLLRLVPNAPEE